jgi:hypothetical protein
MAKTKSYGGVLSSAMLQGLTTGLWVAAGGLTPPRRRAVRAAIVVGCAGVAVLESRLEKEKPQLLDTPVLVKDVLAREVTPPAESGVELPSRATLVAIAVSSGLTLGGRLLEKRWLARLVRTGHTRPYRSLGIRMGVLAATTTLASEVVEVVEARRVRGEPPG